MVKMIKKFFNKRFIKKRIYNSEYILQMYSMKRDICLERNRLEEVERLERCLLLQEIELDNLYKELESL